MVGNIVATMVGNIVGKLSNDLKYCQIFRLESIDHAEFGYGYRHRLILKR